MNRLPPSREQQLLQELTTDRSKEFKAEWERTNQLAVKVLNDEGEAGAALLVERASKAVAGWAPGCPWPDPSGASIEVARAILQPLAQFFPEAIEALLQRLRFAIPVLADDRWHMAYVFPREQHDGALYVEYFAGGAPNPAPKASDRLENMDWIVPPSLCQVYATHDGFGPRDGVQGIASCSELRDLGEMLDPIAAKQGRSPDGYEFVDLLEFCPDGAGNSQCFHAPDCEDDPLTVDWDHETWEIGAPVPFAEFADEALCRGIEQEE